MGAITSLIINDYFGGNICKIHMDGISHYFNLVVRFSISKLHYKYHRIYVLPIEYNSNLHNIIFRRFVSVKKLFKLFRH